MCASEYISHKSCCSSQLMVEMIFDRLCANVTTIRSITPTRGGRSYIWTCLPYRGRAFSNLALPLGRRCKHLPTQGWGSGSWIRDFSEQSLSLSSQKKRRWVQQPNKEGNWWCTTCLTTGRASLLSSRLASTTWWFSPWPIGPALQECIWRESLNWSIVQVTCYKYGCWHKLHILTQHTKSWWIISASCRWIVMLWHVYSFAVGQLL